MYVYIDMPFEKGTAWFIWGHNMFIDKYNFLEGTLNEGVNGDKLNKYYIDK